jgi:hypothetical protein
MVQLFQSSIPVSVADRGRSSTALELLEIYEECKRYYGEDCDYLRGRRSRFRGAEGRPRSSLCNAIKTPDVWGLRSCATALAPLKIYERSRRNYEAD